MHKIDYFIRNSLKLEQNKNYPEKISWLESNNWEMCVISSNPDSSFVFFLTYSVCVGFFEGDTNLRIKHRTLFFFRLSISLLYIYIQIAVSFQLSSYKSQKCAWHDAMKAIKYQVRLDGTELSAQKHCLTLTWHIFSSLAPLQT